MSGLIVDLFAGGGGASVGLAAALGREPDVAVNHDEIAITVHRKNHPETRHYTKDIFEVPPLEATGGQPVDILWASPDCTHHSRAKGDVPRDQKIRALADVVIPWARLTKPRFIFVENVPEFEGWGPLGDNGRPLKSKKGHLFQGWVSALRQLGYNVEWRVLNCSEYGAPTKRMRLFVVARRDGLPVAWPEKTHGPGRPNELVPAWRCIDWSLPCPSIFMTPEEVKEQGLRIRRPLAEKTMKRIANGVRRYVLEAQEPFLIRTGHWNATTGEGSQFRGQGLTDPLATVCATNDKALITPVVTKVNHGRDEDRSQDIEDPLTTVCAQRRGHAVVQATIEPVDTSEITPCPDGDVRWHVPNGYCVDDKGLEACLENELREEGLKEEEIVKLLAPALMKFRGDSAGKSVNGPVPTITGGGNTERPAGHAHAMGLLGASLVKVNHGDDARTGRREHSVEKPLTAVTAKGNGHALVAAAVVKQNHGDKPCHGADEPLHTITTQGNKHNLVSAFLAKHYGGVVGHSLRRPVGTVTARDHHALAAASLVKFRGTSPGHMKQPDIREPLDTISAGGNHVGEVRAFLTKYYGCPQESGQSLFDSVHTITGADRFGLVTIQGEEYQIVDIGMRMLQPHELLAAQFGEFSQTYSFDVTKKDRFGNDVPLGNGDKVRLIGNSVPPHVVRALVTANCDDIVAKEKAA